MSQKMSDSICKYIEKNQTSYYTTITNQVIQLVLVMLVGTHICVSVVFVWEETRVPGGNQHTRLGDQTTI